MARKKRDIKDERVARWATLWRHFLPSWERSTQESKEKLDSFVEKIGISFLTLKRWCKGDQLVQTNKLHKVAKGLNIPSGILKSYIESGSPSLAEILEYIPKSESPPRMLHLVVDENSPKEIIKGIKRLFSLLKQGDKEGLLRSMRVECPHESLRTLLENREIETESEIWGLASNRLEDFLEGKNPPPTDPEISLLATMLELPRARVLKAAQISYTQHHCHENDIIHS